MAEKKSLVEPGAEVITYGLKNKPELNGEKGRVIGFKEVNNGQAVVVHFGNEAMMLFADNIQVVPNSTIEMRIDTADNALYTLDEFIEFYGTEKGKASWDTSKKYETDKPVYAKTYSSKPKPKGKKPKPKGKKPKAKGKKTKPTPEPEVEPEAEPEVEPEPEREASPEPIMQHGGRRKSKDAGKVDKKKTRKAPPPPPPPEPSEPSESSADSSTESDASGSGTNSEEERRQREEEERRRAKKEKKKEEEKKRKAEEKAAKKKQKEQKKQKKEEKKRLKEEAKQREEEEKRKAEAEEREEEERRRQEEEKEKEEGSESSGTSSSSSSTSSDESEQAKTKSEEGPKEDTAETKDPTDPGKDVEEKEVAQSEIPEAPEVPASRDSSENKPLVNETNTHDGTHTREVTPPTFTEPTPGAQPASDHGEAAKNVTPALSTLTPTGQPFYSQDVQALDTQNPLSDPLRRRAYMTEELEKFYKKNNPEKVSQAWVICGRAIDREPDLYKKLAQKYPEAVLELDWLLAAVNANSKQLAREVTEETAKEDNFTLSEKSSPVPSAGSDESASASPESTHPHTPQQTVLYVQAPPETLFDQYSSPFYSTRKAVEDQQKLYDGSPKEVLRRSIESQLRKVDSRLLQTVDTHAMAEMYIGRERDLEKALLAAAGGAYSAKDGKLSTKDVKLKTPYRNSTITTTYQPMNYHPLNATVQWQRKGRAPVTPTPLLEPILVAPVQSPELQEPIPKQVQIVTPVEYAEMHTPEMHIVRQVQPCEMSTQTALEEAELPPSHEELQGLINQIKKEDEKVRLLTKQTGEASEAALIATIQKSAEMLKTTIQDVANTAGVPLQSDGEVAFIPDVRPSDSSRWTQDEERDAEIDAFLESVETGRWGSLAKEDTNASTYAVQVPYTPSPQYRQPQPQPPTDLTPVPQPRQPPLAQPLYPTTTPPPPSQPGIAELETQMKNLLDQQLQLEQKMGLKPTVTASDQLGILRQQDQHLQQQQSQLLQTQEQELQKLSLHTPQKMEPPRHVLPYDPFVML
eukprot:TRINITY_DN3835_c0_g2_i1.p1 TRINITY_DN3835_c0_g2~~TRINITY_DN3835_c0_g2_i1.p1  ORF type:complete len:1030 (+),score=257.97 TRINITY_DN3835_c0_g2_i1:49-3138(+)